MVPCYVVESLSKLEMFLKYDSFKAKPALLTQALMEAIAQSLDACIAHTILGDLLNRNQWKSMVCLVQSAVPRGRRNLSKNGSLCFQNPD
ncbi:unnamed protein product [Camellia sinensis]